MRRTYQQWIVFASKTVLMHSEARQTEALEFEAEEGLLRGRTRKTGGSCSNSLNTSMGSGEKFL